MECEREHRCRLEGVGRKNRKNTVTKFSLFQYINKFLIIALTGKSAYYACISNGIETSSMPTVGRFLDIRARPDLSSKDFVLTDWL